MSVLFEEEVIDSFSGEYRFLSNFFYINPPIVMDDIIYHTTEHAYQAHKTNDINLRKAISIARTPGIAKTEGRNVKIRDDWEDVKIDVMRRCLRLKFMNYDLAMKLYNTGSAKLIEGNWWHDHFWGVCDGKGENHLGKLLMEIRDDLRVASAYNPLA